MKINVYAVRDRAMDGFLRPIFVQSDGVAIRSFVDELNRAAPDNAMYAHPDDYDLYYLGTFHEETGTFNTQPPKQIAIGKQVAIRDNQGANNHAPK